MNISSPQILLMFVIMGGLIAYLGDWLGRKMGKKRLRIAGLRPRHTATFFTVLMGMLIPILTTYAILTISAPVRQWLTEGTEIVKARDALNQQVNGLNIKYTQLRGLTKQAVYEKQLVVGERDKARQEKTAAEAKTLQANQKLTVAAQRERQVQSRVTQLMGRYKTLAASVQDKTKEVADQLVELNKSKTEVGRLRSETERMNANSIALTQQILDLERQRKQAQEDAAASIAQKNKAESDAQKAYDTLLNLRQTIMQARQDLATLVADKIFLRTSNVLYRKGEELGRLAIPGGLNEQGATEKLDQLVKVADLAAKERGVKPDRSGRAAAMDVIKRRLPDGSTITITVQDQIAAFVQAITRSKQEIVLIASAYYNYFSGEDQFLPLDINLFLNRPVYKANDVVAETTIDGSLTEDKVLDSIVEFLRTKVRVAAETAGMIPIHGQEGSLGEISFEQMATLVRQIRYRGMPTKVTAFAAKTTKSAEQLTLRFKVQGT